MKRFILTVGPSLLHEVPLTEVHSEKNIYRINGAHGSLEDIRGTIEEIRRQIPSADILIDLPGNKVRTHGLSEPIVVEKGKTFELAAGRFNYRDYYKHLEPGMVVWADDSTLKFIVENVSEERIRFRSESNGILKDNKGMHVRGIYARGGIPFLFPKDRALIDLCNEMSIEFVGLSFVRTVENIREAKKLINSSSKIISKVETEEAVKNLQDILEEVEYILVDRGDLSTEIGLEKVPQYQKYIIETALYNSRKVFLATQVLKNMETKPIPTVAEINDLYTVWKMGVYGVQMSEETAVGKYVKECIEVLKAMDREILSERLV